MDFFKIITENSIEIEWNPAIVFCRIKAQNVVDSINPHVGVVTLTTLPSFMVIKF